MRQVKGSMMKSFIRPARANKTGIYQESLTDEWKKSLIERIIYRSSIGCSDYPQALWCLFLGKATLEINPQMGKRVSKE
ncbi:MAG: hypothetical protein ACFFAS_00640 [Promethearchaeota archaeon]